MQRLVTAGTTSDQCGFLGFFLGGAGNPRSAPKNVCLGAGAFTFLIVLADDFFAGLDIIRLHLDWLKTHGGKLYKRT